MADLTRLLSTTGLVPLAPPRLTSIDGFVGVFTPIAQQGTTSPGATQNLQEIVGRLTDEVGALQRKNVEMQSRLDKALAPATSSDDLASALQRTVNRLQTELASLSNPISNFAVKDFRLETSLTVSVTELGSVEFRLLQPGANVDPNAISKLTLSLVPIEKQRVDGTFAASLFEPDKDLASIGVSAPLRSILERNHIFTIGEFRAAAMRAQVRTSLIAANLTTQAEMALLQARAELVLLAGIDREIAEALIEAHVDSLRALASCSPQSLALILPGVDPVKLARWIDAAKAFDGGAAADAQHLVAVSTEPASLLVRMGEREAFTATAIVRQLPATQPVALQTLRSQLRDRIAYLFEGWSTGAMTASTTVRAEGDVKAVARFRLAGHWVHAASASTGGKVTLSPVVGGIAGVSPSCYVPGDKIQIVATPDKGYVVRGVTIATEGSTRTVTSKQTSVVVNAPIDALATFMARPAGISSITPPVPAPRGGGFLSSVVLTSREPVPGFEVRVTAAKFETTGGTGTVTLRSELPLKLGDLPVDGRTTEQSLMYDLPATVTTFNIFLTVLLRNAAGDVFTDQHSIGHRNPGAV